MNKFEIIEFMNANPVCHLATLEGDRPRVRGMMMYRADESGVLFHTGAPKDLFRQVRENPNVEICFHNADFTVQVRVAGTAEIVEDESLKREIVEERPFLKSIVEAHGFDLLKVFRVANCVATPWTMEKNLDPKTFIEL
jgi:uncharacterized pyridoxamine 5'-phosphate oxidase family protein